MIRLIEGGFYSDVKGKILAEIKAITENKKQCFLIVPEQQTLLSEGEMAKELPSFAPLFFEATNFTRFANTVFRNLGGVAKEFIDRTKRMLIMWQTLSTLSPALNMTEKSKEINTGMVDKAISAMVKMQSASIEAENLNEVLNSKILASNNRLKAKIKDLSLIMTLYKKTLKEKYDVAFDELTTLCLALEEKPDYLRDCEIFIEGFTSFTEPQYKLISTLAKRAKVNVALTIPKLLSDSPEYTEAKLSRERIKQIAKRANIEIKLTRVDGIRQGVSPAIYEIGSLLWHSFSSVDYSAYSEEEKNAVRIFEGKSPYEACQFIGADIKRRVMKGARYSDFAIIARDANDYAGILTSTLSSYEVPHFISKSKDASSFEAVKLINSAYRVIFGDFARDDVISYTKCSLCGISREACDEFEEYTYKWDITKRRFYDGLLWNMSPRGLEVSDEGDREILLSIDATKKAVITPLTDFKEAISKCENAKEHSLALFEFMQKIGLEKAIKRQSEELFQIGEVSLSEDNERLWKVICDCLDTICDTVGDLPCTKEGYLNLLTIAFSSAKLSKIPAYLDEVTIGSADMIRLSGKRHVYIIGVNSGEFPRNVGDGAYFTEREKLTLSNLGLSITPENEIEYAKELFAFSRAFSYAGESVTLIYNNTKQDFSKSERSQIIDRIVEICGGELKVQSISDLPVGDLIYTKKSALLALNRMKQADFDSISTLFCGVDESRLISQINQSIENSQLSLSKESLDEIYPSALRLSQSRLEKYNNCPFAYFCEYNLGLKAVEKAKFDARNIGSFIHSILENFFKEVKESNLNIGEITAERKKEMVFRHAKNYLDAVMNDGLGDAARAEVMLNRLTRASLPVIDGLCREFEGSSYIPTYFELQIGKSKSDNSPAPLSYKTASGREVYVAGIIDRVDTFKSGEDVYVRVADYKTGQKEFKPSDLDEGENLQMFLYLRAICDTKNEKFRRDIGVSENGRLIPAGVIYVKTDLGDITISTPDEDEALKAFNKKQSRKGMLLDDAVSINAMHKDYIPVKYTSNGEVTKATSDNLYTYEEWEDISKRVEKSVCKIADGMQSGIINSTPKTKKNQSPCDYCNYKMICRRGLVHLGEN